MPNGHMDAIEPYDYRAFQPFSTAYLPGYMADKYDEDADTCQARAHSRMQNSVSSELSASITGYNNVSTLSENISIDYTAKHYALLPVWMLHTKWQGKDYLFAMNGQTGKLVGDLPVDKRKVAAWFAGISVPLMILLASCFERGKQSMKKKLFSLLTALLLCLFCALSAFAEMPLVMDTYTHTTETETYDPVKDDSSSSGSSTDSDGFGGSSGGKF